MHVTVVIKFYTMGRLLFLAVISVVIMGDVTIALKMVAVVQTVLSHVERDDSVLSDLCLNIHTQETKFFEKTWFLKYEIINLHSYL